MDGDIYDQFGEAIDRRLGGVRAEAHRRAATGPPPSAIFRLWQEKEEPPFGVEEVGSDEEVTQGLRGGSKTEEAIIIESDDEEEEERTEPPSVLFEKMKDLLDKMGRYQQKLVGLCEEVKQWRSNIPTVLLYDSGPESAPGRPGVNVVGSCPQPGLRGRPLTPQARLAQAARTRNQATASTSQEPPRREHEPGRRKKVVEVEDGDDEEEEDERLRREEDQRAEQRARKKGIRGEAEPVIQDGPPKKKKYVVWLEEGFHVEKVIDRLPEGHNDLMTLKEILESAPRLRYELKGRLSRRLVPNVHLGTILPKEAEWAESGTKMDWKCVACCTVDLMVKGSKCAAMVDTGAEMNIIREADAIRFGLDIDRSDCGILHGVCCKAMFFGTISNVLVEVGKVKRKHRAYAFSDEEHGRLDVDKIPMIRIHTVPHEPWNIRGARYPNPDKERKVVDYLDGKIRTHVADYSSGPYASPWFCFIKPNGTLQWVLDLQRLDAVAVRDAGGLPNADALSESCAGRPIISLIDLYSGYDQFPVYLPDRPVTVVHTPRGLESLDQSGSLNPTGNVDEIPERQDDEFEEGEIKEVFGAEEYDGIYLELGLLSCEMRLRDTSDRAQRMLQRYLVRDGHLFVRREVGNPRRVVCGRNRQINVVAALHDGIAGGHRGVQATSDFTKTAMPRGGKGTRSPQRPLGASGGYERHGPRQRESTPVYNDGDIELFLDSFSEHARRMGWTVTQAIERLRGAGKFEKPIARIRREATTRQEVEIRMEEMRPSPVGPEGRPIRLEIGNASDFIPAFEWFMQEQGIQRDDWMQTLPLWTRKAERPLAMQIRDMARECESCRAHLREAFRWPELPQPRVERRQRSQRPRDPEPLEARPSRGGRKALARREQEPEDEERGAYSECGLGPVEFHRFTEGGLRRSPAHTQEEPPASEGPLRELGMHLDISRWRASLQGEGHGEQAKEVPREEVPQE
ncbi:hypothetical protein CBR_g37877 [Chara braunii]|uniref:Reverse transcriptase domain-containing protein n=1 Tax=Chara braunii TaxID=69332 RepID=A0A388LP62_CHABU|nr:hypothetical protein CBR_g37877 [Chara braunii]|eukprot:GBG84003.1 hypothetical protein CBR_g37877 [Chara braunii]